jgi:hypothetical protein
MTPPCIFERMRFFSNFRGVVALGLAGMLAVNCGSDDGAKRDQGEAGAAGEAESSAGQPSTSGGSLSQAGEAAGGSSANVGGDAAGGSGAGGAPTMDAGAAGLGGSMESAGAGGGGQLIELSCQDANPGAPATQPTTVNFVNNTASNIYLGSPAADCAFGFQLFDGDAELVPARGNCDKTCGELQQDDCECAFPCAPLVTMLAPGGKYGIGWPGTVFTSHLMADECFADPTCAGQQCLIESAAPAKSLTIRGAGYPEWECDAGECFDCTPGGNNKNCTVIGAKRTKGTPLVGEVTWSGQSGIVTVNFGTPPT